jgi:hypothetical protein
MRRTASAPRSVAQRATLPMHRDLAEVARHVAECRTATQPQPHRDRRAACRRSWSTANRTETGCRSTAAAPRPGRCEPQAARERSPARPVADVQPMRTAPHPHRGRLPSVQRCRCTETWPMRTVARPNANRYAARPVAEVVHRDQLPTCTVLIGQFRKNARAAGWTLHSCPAAKISPLSGS